MTATKNGTTWPKPGPGSWELDTAHFSADCSRILQEVMVASVGPGSAAGLALVGGPVERMDAAFVNGRFYRRLVPIVGGSVDRPPPPDWVLRLLSRIHPKFRKADRTAANALANRSWLDELGRWDDEWKPAVIKRCRDLATVETSELSDKDLATHFAEALENVTEGIELHFRLHVSDLGPIGLLLVRSRELGIGDAKALATLAGASPATSAPAKALVEIRELVDAQNQPANDLAELRALSPEINDAVDQFLSEYGWRVTTGYDIRDLTLAEMPEVVYTSIVSAQTNSVESHGEAAAEAFLEIVPPTDRPEFETLITDARLLYGLRDENGPITFEWPAGLLRRAVVEISRRLDAKGKLPTQTRPEEINDSVFDLTSAEMTGLLLGAEEPGPDEISARTKQRNGFLDLDPPIWLGPELPDPNPDVFPESTAQLLKVVLTVIELLESKRGNASEVLQGIGIGSEAYVGRACVATEAEDALIKMEPGDVLVAPFTVPTYNTVLAMAGAVVVNSGGLLCHAAVLAREYGIAGVVGAGPATAVINDGDTVRVDPVNGTVTVVAEAATELVTH